MPDDLAGLCKLRIGDWRILYWIYHARKLCVSIESSTGRKCIAASKDVWGHPFSSVVRFFWGSRITSSKYEQIQNDQYVKEGTIVES